ncbi:MAG: serine hydrolase domain-containing protein [Bacteroidia bacterium]
MKKTIIKLLTASLIALSINSCETKAELNPIQQQLEVAIDSLLQKPEFEAISLGMIHQGQSYTLHRGKLLNGHSPNKETLYEIASLSKTFTGTLLAKALVENKLSLDADIRTYMEGDYPNLAYEGQPILLRHLATHQSGLPLLLPDREDIFIDNPDWDKVAFEVNRVQSGFSRDQFFDSLAQVQLDTIPGHKLRYSNAGTNLVAYILEEVYEQSFVSLLQAHIFDPLAMRHSSIELSKVDPAKLAQGVNANKTPMPARVEKAMNAEGGIISNVDDMLRYMAFHLDESNAWVSGAHAGLWGGQYGDYDAGLFWQIFRDGDKPDRFFQNGGAFGTSSYMILLPESKTGIFIISNVSGANIHQYLSETIDKILKSIEEMN